MRHKDRKLTSCAQALTAILSCIVVLLAMRFVGSAPGTSSADRDALTGVAEPPVPTSFMKDTGSFSSAREHALVAKPSLSDSVIDAPGSLVGTSPQSITAGQSASDGTMATEPDKKSTPSSVKEKRLASSPGAIWEEETPSSSSQKQLPSEQTRAERATPHVNRVLFARGASSLGLKVARAEDAPNIPGSRAPDAQESTQFAAGQQEPTTSPTQQTAVRTTIKGLVQAFISESDPEGKQNLLAAAAEFPESDGISMRQILKQALLAHQPLKVRQQALYLAADMAPDLVQKIAADHSHPLRQEAEAFLLEAKLSAGIIPPNSDD